MKIHPTLVMLFVFMLSSVLPLYPEETGKMIKTYVAKMQVDPSKSIEENTGYRKLLLEKSGPGDSALSAFGSLGPDIFVSDKEGVVKNLVGSAIEYYYTDLVYVKCDYSTALKGLYSQRKEDPDKAGQCDEAISLVFKIASGRGVTLKPADEEMAWKRERSAELLYYGKSCKCNDAGVKLITEYYFNNMSYAAFINRLRAMQEKDFASVIPVLSVIGYMNSNFVNRISADIQ